MSRSRRRPRAGLLPLLLFLAALSLAPALVSALAGRPASSPVPARYAAHPAAPAQEPQALARLPLLLRTAGGNWATPLPAFAPFGTVRLAPDLRLAGSGEVVDSLAFWEAPDPADSLLLVTAKGNGRVEVWQAPFEGGERPPLEHPSFAGGAVNGIAVDPAADRLYVALARPASTVAVFGLPELGFLRTLVDAEVDLRGEPNLALLELPEGGHRLYVSADDRVYRYDPESGAALGSFRPAAALETLQADAFHQRLYLPDEVGRSGIYAYHPDGQPYLQGDSNRFGQDVFEADAEGIALYACRGADGRDDGRGLLIVSDQKAALSDFEVFDRRSWAHLGRLQLEGVAGTDGIASTRQALPGYPQGLFAAVNADREVALIGWQRVLAATGLDCRDGAAGQDPPG